MQRFYNEQNRNNKISFGDSLIFRGSKPFAQKKDSKTKFEKYANYHKSHIQSA